MLAITVNLVYTLINLSISVFAYLRRVRQKNSEELKVASIRHEQAEVSVDATRMEAESIVVDMDQEEKKLVPAKRRQKKTSIAEFPDLFTI